MDHHPHRTHHHDHQPHQPHQRSDVHDQHHFLDLDAEVFGDNLSAVLDITGAAAARGVVDLGAGTGAGSRLLRERFPDAAVTCVDNDPQMLELLREQGFAVVQADLDDGFPPLAGSLITTDAGAEAPVDLVWASSSLHHVAHPAQLLSEVRRALAPGGVLVVVELATLPSFLRDPSGALLEQRCHTAATAEGWNHYPDWTPIIEAAGFVVTKSEVTTHAPVTPAALEYAQQWFARFAHLAALTDDDRDAVQNLLPRINDLELEPRATRTVWVATPELHELHDDKRTDADAVACFDVAVIGGGAAGLSAAVALGRFAQSVVVIDDATPRNAAAGHVHNLLTRDGTPPAELYQLGQLEVERYGGRLVTGTVSSIHGSVGAFTVQLENQVIGAGRIIVATGGRDELPDIPGLAPRWGKDVVHCAFCHGYEVRNQRIGVLATGPMASHQSMMFRLLSPHVTVLAHTAPPTPDQCRDLAQRGIAVVPGTVAEVLSHHDQLTGVRLDDGSHVDLDALVVSSIVHARAEFLAPLGLLPTDFTINGHVMATRIETGPNGATTVPGVWIAGNTSEPMAQVVNAAAGGLAAASAIIGEVVVAPPIHRALVETR